MRIGEFNLGIREGDKVEMHFDEKQLAFIFQGNLPNNHVWLKATRLYVATGSQIQNAPTLAGDMQRKYGFEIHIHTYYINKILPDFLKHQLPLEYKRKDEYQETLKNIASQMEQAKTAAFNTQSAPNIGKVYAADYQKVKVDYETLLKEWQELEQRYLRESQELQRLATNANAAIFTISISSDLKVVPDGSAVPLALKDCLQELNMRHNALINDATMQNIRFAVVRQPYFFFLSELAGMFNPVMLVSMARNDPNIFDLYKEMFPAINAKSMLQGNLENMRHLSSNAPAEMLRRVLQQMELSVPVIVPPAQQVTQQGTARVTPKIPERDDNLKEGELIGKRIIDDEKVRINLRKLDSHILIEGYTGRGKSSFARLLATIAMDAYKMKVIAMDTSYHWSVLSHNRNSIIFDKKLDVKEALQHPFSLCSGRNMSTKELEDNFLKPFYDYIKDTRGMESREDKDILLIIDEAHNFGERATQRQGVLTKIISELLKYGVIVLLITQFRKNLSKALRSQAGLRFNTQLTPDYYEDFKSLYGIEIAESMFRVKKFNLYVQSADFNNWFEIEPLMLPKLPELKPHEMEQYRYKPKEETIQPKAEPKKQEIAPEIKQEPPKPPEPEKTKDELNENERKVIDMLKASGGSFKSESKLAQAIGQAGSGDTIRKVCKSLMEKGYILIESGSSSTAPKTFRLTEKGKAYQPS